MMLFLTSLNSYENERKKNRRKEFYGGYKVGLAVGVGVNDWSDKEVEGSTPTH